MSVSVVVDASLIVSLMVPDERQGEVQLQRERWVDTGGELRASVAMP
jgi:predicted nucleic acid-binding protein